MLVTQLCPTLCDPIDYSLPGSSVHGILQGGEYLEWIEYWEWIVSTPNGVDSHSLLQEILLAQGIKP